MFDGIQTSECFNIRANVADVPKKVTARAAIAALCSAVIPGAGYLFSKMYVRAAIFMSAAAVLAVVYVLKLASLLKGLITLGEVAMVNGMPKDNSNVFLVMGFIAFIVTVFTVIFYVSNIIGAYKGYIKTHSAYYERLTRKEEFKRFLSKQTPLLFMIPGTIAVCAVVLLPFLYSFSLAFTNFDKDNSPPLKLFSWVGFSTFKSLLSLGGYGEVLLSILGWNIVFMFATSVLPYVIGVFLALLLTNPKIKGKKIFRVIYILPWAIPGYISTMMLKVMFHSSGPINQLIMLFNESLPVNWLYETTPARAACIIVATWLGFSFPMMMSESILSSIPSDIYEAARLDGAGKTRILYKITLPLLMFSIAPIFVMAFSGAFNNMNVIVLLTGGAPYDYKASAGKTDILISWLYKLTTSARLYNIAAAVSIVLFIAVSALSIFNLMRTRNFKEEDMLS